jgi:NAD(P)-dependent dehydrogenase (short-subunit alcohol dehydrogenase family)
VSKIVLITGANKGIGFEVARQLGRSGYRSARRTRRLARRSGPQQSLVLRALTFALSSQTLVVPTRQPPH